MLEEENYDDESIVRVIKEALGKKHFSHGGVDSILKRSNRAMVRIGFSILHLLSKLLWKTITLHSEVGSSVEL